MRDVPPVTCMDTRKARLGRPERRDPIACPKRALPPTAVGGHAAAYVTAETGGSRTLNASRKTAAFSPGRITTTRSVHGPNNIRDKPMGYRPNNIRDGAVETMWRAQPKAGAARRGERDRREHTRDVTAGSVRAAPSRARPAPRSGHHPARRARPMPRRVRRARRASRSRRCPCDTSGHAAR